MIGVFNGARSLGAAIGVALALATASGASAVTMTESEIPGAFSGDWRSPTVIAGGIEQIAGIGGASSDDYFLFTGLPAGAQTLSLDFSAPAGIGPSYSAGGFVLFDTKPFAHEWAGARLEQIKLNHKNVRQSVALELPDTFAGQLYLALNFTHGENIAYALSAPSNALILPDQFPGSELETPHAVPLPATGLMLGFLCLAAGLFVMAPRRARRTR